MTAFLLQTASKDWTARVFLLTLGVFWTLYLFPALSPGRFGAAAWDHMHLLLIPIVLFSFRHKLGREIPPGEKQFWNFISIAFGLWFVVRLTYLFDLPKEESVAGSVLTGALYVGFYLAFLLAVTVRPHIEWPREELRRRERLESYATVTLAMGVLVYFVLLPRGLHRGVPEFEALARAMFLSLDLFLLFRLLHVRRFCHSVRWRTIYLLLAGSMGLWGVVDLADLLNETGIFTWQSLTLDLMFDLGFLTTLLAARAHRLLPADERPGDVTDLDPDAQLRLRGRRNLLLTYAVALPAVHGLLVLAGWFDPAALPYREFVVLIFLAVLGILAFYDRREIEYTSRLVWEQYLAERSDLIESEGKFRDLFENSNDLIQSVRADGSYEYVNPAWQDALGYQEEEISSLRFLDVVAPEERAHCEEILAGLQKGESFAHVKTVFLAKNGRRVFVEGSVSAQMRRGNLIATRGFFQDVTGHKRAEKARDASDARFRVLFESSPYGLVIVNEYGLIILANPEMEAMFGYARGELNGKTIESLMPARYQAGHIGKRLAFFDHPVARPMKSGLELYALKKDGTEFPVEIALGPFKTESGTLVAACVMDVTKSKEAGDALKKSEERYRELVESSPGFIGKHDLDGAILSVNPAMAHNLGYAPEEMIGKNGELFLGPQGQKGLGRYMKLLMKDGSASGRVGLRTREGGERIWEYRCALHRESGDKPYVLGYAQDITERHRAERELRKMTTELEERVRE